jgi:hypothetical protein
MAVPFLLSKTCIALHLSVKISRHRGKIYVENVTIITCMKHFLTNTALVSVKDDRKVPSCTDTGGEEEGS